MPVRHSMRCNDAQARGPGGAIALDIARTRPALPPHAAAGAAQRAKPRAAHSPHPLAAVRRHRAPGGARRGGPDHARAPRPGREQRTEREFQQAAELARQGVAGQLPCVGHAQRCAAACEELAACRRNGCWGQAGGGGAAMGNACMNNAPRQGGACYLAGRTCHAPASESSRSRLPRAQACLATHRTPACVARWFAWPDTP